MIRLHKADQREHLPRLSDLHLLVLKIHRAVCKPCGPLLSFLFQISHTPLCFLLAAHVEFRFVLSTKPVKFYLADSPLNFHAEFFKPNLQLALSLCLLVRLWDYSVCSSELRNVMNRYVRLSHVTETHKHPRSRLLALRLSLEWI